MEHTHTYVKDIVKVDIRRYKITDKSFDLTCLFNTTS